MFIWFSIGGIYYIFQFPGEISLALLHIFFLVEPSGGDIFSTFYALIGTIIISQGIFAFILTKSFEKHDPKLSSRMIAKEIDENHIVIIHHGHIGSRITNYMKKHGQKYIVIEEKRELVEELLIDGEPVIIGKPTSESVLEDANIKTAKAVIMATNHVAISLVIVNKIRKLNPNCEILIRIFDDRLREILESEPYNAHCFSTSKTTIEKKKDEWILSKKGKAIIIGITHFTQRLVEELINANRDVVIIDNDEDELEYYQGTNIKAFEGDASSSAFLETPEINISEAEQVFIGENNNLSDSVATSANIKKKYPNIDVYVRLFSDDLAEFLERLEVKTFSTSKFTFSLLEKDVLPNLIKKIEIS